MTYELKDGDKRAHFPPILKEMGFGEEVIAALVENLRWKEIETVVEDVTEIIRYRESVVCQWMEDRE